MKQKEKTIKIGGRSILEPVNAIQAEAVKDLKELVAKRESHENYLVRGFNHPKYGKLKKQLPDGRVITRKPVKDYGVIRRMVRIMPEQAHVDLSCTQCLLATEQRRSYVVDWKTWMGPPCVPEWSAGKDGCTLRQGTLCWGRAALAIDYLEKEMRAGRKPPVFDLSNMAVDPRDETNQKDHSRGDSLGEKDADGDVDYPDSWHSGATSSECRMLASHLSTSKHVDEAMVRKTLHWLDDDAIKRHIAYFNSKAGECEVGVRQAQIMGILEDVEVKKEDFKKKKFKDPAHGRTQEGGLATQFLREAEGYFDKVPLWFFRLIKEDLDGEEGRKMPDSETFKFHTGHGVHMRVGAWVGKKSHWCPLWKRFRGKGEAIPTIKNRLHKLGLSPTSYGFPLPGSKEEKAKKELKEGKKGPDNFTTLL